MPYHSVERKRNDEQVFNCYILPRLFEMVNKYGPNEDRLYKVPQYSAKGTFTHMDYRKEQKDALMEKLKEWAK